MPSFSGSRGYRPVPMPDSRSDAGSTRSGHRTSRFIEAKDDDEDDDDDRLSLSAHLHDDRSPFFSAHGAASVSDSPAPSPSSSPSPTSPTYARRLHRRSSPAAVPSWWGRRFSFIEETSAPQKASVTTLAIVGLIFSHLVFFMFGAFSDRQSAYTRKKMDRHCSAHTTKYSPILSQVGVSYSSVPFNGSFMEVDVFRQPASPEVDAAWESLGVDYRAGIISHSEGLRSGLTAAHVQRAQKYGGGFFVNVEGMHHLHCLNLLRKSLYYNYPYYKELGTHAFKNDDSIVQLHVSHCLDTIRQVLMCNVDTGVLGQVWYDPENPTAFPDFHTTHTCKNYDDVRKWAEKLQAPLPETLPADYLQPANSEDIWPATP